MVLQQKPLLGKFRLEGTLGVWSKPVDRSWYPPVAGSPQTPLKKGGLLSPPFWEGGVWGGSSPTTFDHTRTLVMKTGLHIGGGGESLDIGGLDKPVVRDPITKYPYIPGSSIKGKLRSNDIFERREDEKYPDLYRRYESVE